MKRDEYLRQLKRLIKKYHPDLCKDEYLEKTYNEITIKLNTLLNGVKNKNTASANAGKQMRDTSATSQSYEYYRLGIKYYKNIHPNQFFKRNADRTYEPKSYDEQLKNLNMIFVSFGSAEYYFTKVINEYPGSEWADDANEKIKLLKKLYKSYENFETLTVNQIIDSGKFVEEMGLKLL